MDIPQKRGPDAPPSLIPSSGFIIGFVAFILIASFVVFYLASSRIIPVLPEVASTQAVNTDNLFYILLGVGGIVFFLVQGLLLYSVIRFRARPNDLSDGPNIHGNPTLEIVWTIIPAVVVVAISGLSVVVWTTNNSPRENENFINGQPVKIETIGARFAWSFQYHTGQTNANGDPIILSLPELHTYVGMNVKLDMYSDDVIHSFWIPEMRVKQDVMPNKVSEIRFTPISTASGYAYAFEYPQNAPLGASVSVPLERRNDPNIANRFNRYQVVCTELCGGGHGQMYTDIVVHDSETSFLTWYNAQVESRRNPPADPVLLGDQVLRSGEYPCASCHVLTTLGWQGITGPSLDGIGDRAGTRATQAGVGDESGADYLVHSIREPHSWLVPGYGAAMPIFSDDPSVSEAGVNYMPDEDVIGIVAYLCTQTGTGVATDSTCGIEFADNGLPIDVDATIEMLSGYEDKYSSVPDS